MLSHYSHYHTMHSFHICLPWIMHRGFPVCIHHIQSHVQCAFLERSTIYQEQQRWQTNDSCRPLLSGKDSSCLSNTKYLPMREGSELRKTIFFSIIVVSALWGHTIFLLQLFVYRRPSVWIPKSFWQVENRTECKWPNAKTTKHKQWN